MFLLFLFFNQSYLQISPNISKYGDLTYCDWMKSLQKFPLALTFSTVQPSFSQIAQEFTRYHQSTRLKFSSTIFPRSWQNCIIITIYLTFNIKVRCPSKLWCSPRLLQLHQYRLFHTPAVATFPYCVTRLIAISNHFKLSLSRHISLNGLKVQTEVSDIFAIYRRSAIRWQNFLDT